MALIVVLQNMSHLADLSDYNYQVLIGDGTPDGSHTIAHGQLLKHRRADGWKPLVQRVIDDVPDDTAAIAEARARVKKTYGRKK